VTPACWSTGAWCPPRGIEPGTCCLQGSCSAAELDGQQNGQTAAATYRGCRQPVADRSRCQTAGPDGSKHAAARTRADTRNFQKQKEVWRQTHATIGRVTRTLSRSLRGILRVFTLLPVGGGLRPPPVNPVVATLAWADRSLIGRARPRARPTTRSVGSTTGRRWRLTRYLCLCGASGSSSLPAGADARRQMSGYI
jgi:hypothetical protein